MKNIRNIATEIIKNKIGDKLSRFMRNEDGDAAQFMILASVVIAPVIIALVFFGGEIFGYINATSPERHYQVDNTVIILALSAALGVLAWIAKMIGHEMKNNAKLHIMELLSKNGAMSRADITKSTKEKFKTFVFIPIIIQISIENLLMSNKITLENGMYKIVNY